MATRISRAVLEDILARARDNPDGEICGLLLGRGDRITGQIPAANVAENPARRFEIDPAVLLTAHRAARLGGPGVLGHYHSHPSADLAPSLCDAQAAHADGALWLIVSGGSHALWRAGSDGLHGCFSPVALEQEDAALASSRPERQ